MELCFAAACGDISEVKRLLSGCEVNKPNPQGTPLFLACQEGHLGVVTYLMTTFPKLINPSQVGYSQEGETPLHVAAQYGRTDVVQYLLTDERIDINVINKKHHTPLFLACWWNQHEVVKLLLSHPSVDINSSTCSPIHFAVRMGAIDCVKLLLERKDLKMNSKHEGTPLHEVCWGHVEIAKLLLADDRIDVDDSSLDGSTALSLSCARGNLEITKLLLPVSNPNVTNDYQMTPFLLSCGTNVEIVKLFLADNRVDVNYVPQENAIYEAVRREQLETVKLLLQDGRVDPNFIAIEHKNPLQHSCIKGYYEIAKALLSDDRVIIPESKKPLIITACMSGNVELVKLLLKDNRVDVNAEYSGEFLLHVATCKSAEMVELILSDPRIDVTLTTSSKQTALHTACGHGSADIVKLLLDDGRIDPVAKDLGGKTAFACSLQSNLKASVIRALLNCEVILKHLTVDEAKRALVYFVQSRPDRIWVEVAYLLWSQGFDPKELHPEMSERELNLIQSRISKAKQKSARKA